jgi:hypothetical protein
MAIGNADGSIILSTKIDESGLKSGMSSLKGITGKISGLMSAAFSVKLLANFAKEAKSLYEIQMQNEVKLATVMRQRVGATDAQIQSVLNLASAEQELGIIGDEVQLAGLQQLATFAKQQETIETLLPAMNNLIAQQNGFEASTGSAVNVANLMGKVLQGQTSALTRVGITFDKAQEEVLKYGNESERAAMLAKVITENVGNMNQALAQTDAGRQVQLANTMGDVKEQFGEVVMQIEILFLPALKALAQTLSKIAVILKTAADALFGGGKESKPEWQQISTSTKQTGENIEDQTEAQKDLNKEVKKTLAGFDELNTISKDTGGALDEATKVSDSGIGSSFGGLGGLETVSEVDETLTKIMGLVGAGLVAIGVVLLCFGQIGLGIGFIVAGATAFVASVAVLKSNEAYENTYNQLMKILGIASGLILVVGIILVCCGVVTPLTIGMIVMGAVGIVTVVALNWDAIKEITKNVFNSVLEWVKTWGLLVLGIILFITGIGMPLGIALIAKGAQGLAASQNPTWNAFLDKIKAAWKAIKDYWNANISKYFKSAWWASLGKNMVNGLIRKIVEGLNKLIEKLNSFGFKLPDVLGGGKVGFNISKLSIPQLAKGAVLPPNKPFLAMVGDQKSGTNIEAPLDTIVDAMRIALGGSNGFSGKIEVPIYLDGRQIAIAVREAENNFGSQTVFGGFANAY